MQTGPELAPPKKDRDIALAIYEWCDAVVYALIAIVLLFTLFFKVTTVVGTSMVNTLHERDTLIISKLGYEPENGDIVVIAMDNLYFQEPIVKRIIASGGETVNINFATHEVSVTDVNGVTRVLQEDYILSPTATAADVAFPLTVPEGMLFVMGDNRNGSTDSRDSRVGLIDERQVLGHVVLRVLPIKDFGVVK
ncbi:MAG: signal peptidase I [Ruminococcaceae bacterium]|nr:signal peptidase I [Oscillospiraceae bacterium]